MTLFWVAVAVALLVLGLTVLAQPAVGQWLEQKTHRGRSR